MKIFKLDIARFRYFADRCTCDLTGGVIHIVGCGEKTDENHLNGI